MRKEIKTRSNSAVILLSPEDLKCYGNMIIGDVVEVIIRKISEKEDEDEVYNNAKENAEGYLSEAKAELTGLQAIESFRIKEAYRIQKDEETEKEIKELRKKLENKMAWDIKTIEAEEAKRKLEADERMGGTSGGHVPTEKPTKKKGAVKT